MPSPPGGGMEAVLTPRDGLGFLPMRALSCGGRGGCSSTGDLEVSTVWPSPAQFQV